MIRRCMYVGILAVVLLTAGCAHVSRNNVDNQAAAIANARLGLDFLGKQQYNEARSKFDRALRYDSSNKAANWGMALLYQRLGEPQQARSYYEKIMGGEVGPTITNSYAVFLCKQGETDRALDYFERAANNDWNQSPAVAMANAGLCLEQSGRLQTARQYYRKALAINKDQPTALTQMAQLQYARGEYLSARAFVERADAVGQLNTKLLLLAARVELALGDANAAQVYLQRHNQQQPAAAMTLDQLGQSS